MTESRDSATQSSEESSQTSNPQQRALRKFMEDNRDNFRIIQVEYHYRDDGDRHYQHEWVITELREWHPRFTTLRLRWTLTGRWVKAPKRRDISGDDFYS